MDTNDVFEMIVGASYEVANVFGPGFLEKVYERALFRELALRGLGAKCQVSFPVVYKDQCVGEYPAAHLRLALLINFQKPRVEWKRIVYGP
jgi:hypothetical protein